VGEVDAANATYRSINALCWSPAVIWKCSGTDGGFGDAYAQKKYTVRFVCQCTALPTFVCKYERIKFRSA
jgi:hypothetical protein